MKFSLTAFILSSIVLVYALDGSEIDGTTAESKVNAGLKASKATMNSLPDFKHNPANVLNFIQVIGGVSGALTACTEGLSGFTIDTSAEDVGNATQSILEIITEITTEFTTIVKYYGSGGFVITEQQDIESTVVGCIKLAITQQFLIFTIINKRAILAQFSATSSFLEVLLSLRVQFEVLDRIYDVLLTNAVPPQAFFSLVARILPADNDHVLDAVNTVAETSKVAFQDVVSICREKCTPSENYPSEMPVCVTEVTVIDEGIEGETLSIQ
ncbi:hypothetical protein C8J56DRAFT_890888 [Mycena floridula]|nr:hypothetical protein C8J56DRAFT_890888 [Mycena floridula]